jgi:ribosome-associated translation inhibitor RaiA
MTDLKRMATPDKLNYNFHTDLEKGKKRIIRVIENKVAKFQKRYDEIFLVDINMDTGEKEDTPYNVKSTVILKTKVKNFVGRKIEKNPLLSLREAFSAAEVQLKKHLDKLSHKWEIHDRKNNKTSFK